MATFTFHLLTSDGEARSFEIHECGSEYHARQLLPSLFDRHPTSTAIELWDGESKLFRTERMLVDSAAGTTTRRPTLTWRSGRV